jgi:pilus assembly protein CpaB
MTRNFLLIAAALVAVGILVVTLYRGKFIEERAGGEPISVVVARQTIPFGEPVRLEWLTTRILPSDYVEDRHIDENRLRDLVGLPLAQTVRAGESIMSTDLSELSNYRRTLSGEIPSGSRAITLQVPFQSSFSGLLRPGDRVDAVLLAGPPDSNDFTASVVLQNALVLAIGQTIARQLENESSSTRVRAVTLQIGVNDGQRLAHARREGRIQFLLRNGSDDHVVPGVLQIQREDIEIAGRRERFLYRDRRRSDVEAALAAATAAVPGAAPAAPAAPPAPTP